MAPDLREEADNAAWVWHLRPEDWQSRQLGLLDLQGDDQHFRVSLNLCRLRAGWLVGWWLAWLQGL